MLAARISEKMDLPKSIKSLNTLTPEQKEAKILRFQKKMEKAQFLLIEVKPFIEVSKPFLRDLQNSFDLKNRKP
jgi:hypothetical protein